jgi:hypothetical protein
MDPTLSASTFPFGSQQNRGKSAAVDSARFRPNSHRELGSSYKLLGPAPPSRPINSIRPVVFYRGGNPPVAVAVHATRSIVPWHADWELRVDEPKDLEATRRWLEV